MITGNTMEIITVIILVAAACTITYFVTRTSFSAAVNSLETEKAVAETANSQTKTRLEESVKELVAERKKSFDLNAVLSKTEENNRNLGEKINLQKKELEEIQQRLKTEFENIANKILDDNSKKFTEQNRTNLDVILNPFKEKIKTFEEKVEKAFNEEMREKSMLKGEIKTLFELNKIMSEETKNLTRALKGDNKNQGNWGELVLEKILESSGLVKDREYKTQVVSENVDGEKIKPDVIIYLPDEKHVVIDSKVSLTAYEKFVNAVDNDERELRQKEHLISIKNHIKLLSEKHYQTMSGISSPDFVLLFIPIESSFGAAVQADKDLFNFAWDRRIVMVSPSTLLATLRTIASIWKQERQNRNAMLIAEEGGKLYDKFVSFVDDLVRLGKKMDDAKTDYTEAMKKLYEGSGNLVKRAEKMKELGAKAQKNIAPQLIERAE